ncbi:Acetoin utilization deacetylase AcuC [Tistlia consotensis]|uniref:Acetoin utilization deacetylase AcuC n=1 Tax=Tistlia consotensis USBA 355 TaxID=560819 RepID=A0A1Y6CBR0_9PROT|nr:class II histone deacetylase [Tistlia consotensis]SMF55776.1 Acetoin utilization deacetylase AcuC [Tistlia consotensis USBA 355]SNR89261.1 Acetoin utilization deacetylase AcuC [Tistlia consotensis]
MATGFVFHEIYMWHNTWNWAQVFPPSLTVQPGEHAENPETKRRFRNLLEVSGLLDRLLPLKARAASEDEIARFHTRDYIERIKRASAGSGGDASHLTPFGTGSFEIAQLSAGGTMAAFDAVITGAVRNAYALVRPPGHHAIADAGLGFCLFGNVALAIMHARAVHGLGRIATVDWDVHHGNGTQAAFYSDPTTLTLSIHQDNLYPPDSGGLDEIGEGAGRGYNLNIPLPPGSGDGAYLAAFERVVLPALRRFRPELIVVPSGFDASGVDPLGRMMVSSEGYRAMTRLLLDAADELCAGRLVMSHEGGYSATYVPYCGLAVLEELSGFRTGVEDPWGPLMAGWGGQALAPHQEAVIEAAAARLAGIR